MIALTITIHVFVCLALIVIVLLQAGKGADMGAAFGGSSQTIFGSSGAGGFMEKLTAAIAVIFMLTSLTLSFFSAQRPSSSVMEETPIRMEERAPVTPSSPEGE